MPKVDLTDEELKQLEAGRKQKAWTLEDLDRQDLTPAERAALRSRIAEVAADATSGRY